MLLAALLSTFGAMMLATAVAMFRQRPVAIEAKARNSTPWSWLLLEGAFVVVMAVFVLSRQLPLAVRAYSCWSAVH